MHPVRKDNTSGEIACLRTLQVSIGSLKGRRSEIQSLRSESASSSGSRSGVLDAAVVHFLRSDQSLTADGDRSPSLFLLRRGGVGKTKEVSLDGPKTVPGTPMTFSVSSSEIASSFERRPSCKILGRKALWAPGSLCPRYRLGPWAQACKAAVVRLRLRIIRYQLIIGLIGEDEKGLLVGQLTYRLKI